MNTAERQITGQEAAHNMSEAFKGFNTFWNNPSLETFGDIDVDSLAPIHQEFTRKLLELAKSEPNIMENVMSIRHKLNQEVELKPEDKARLEEKYLALDLSGLESDDLEMNYDEKTNFIAASVEVACMVFQAEDLSADLKQETKDVFASYGFDIENEEAMEKIGEKYETDPDFRAAIMEALANCDKDNHFNKSILERSISYLVKKIANDKDFIRFFGDNDQDRMKEEIVAFDKLLLLKIKKDKLDLVFLLISMLAITGVLGVAKLLKTTACKALEYVKYMVETIIKKK